MCRRSCSMAASGVISGRPDRRLAAAARRWHLLTGRPEAAWFGGERRCGVRDFTWREQAGRVEQSVGCVRDAGLVQMVGADVVERILDAHWVAALDLDLELQERPFAGGLFGSAGPLFGAGCPLQGAIG